MANGIGERPLPSVEAEKSLMGTTGIYGTTKFEVPNGSTRYLVFSSG